MIFSKLVGLFKQATNIANSDYKSEIQAKNFDCVNKENYNRNSNCNRIKQDGQSKKIIFL